MLISNGQAVFITHVFSQALNYKKVTLKENLSFIRRNSHRAISSYLRSS